MPGSFHFGCWDAALLAGVSLQGTAIAYLREPRWKALLLSVPVPFTLASLALGSPVGPTHAAAVVLLMLYTHAVRLLHYRLGVRIVAAIVVSALGYCVAGAALTPLLPNTEAAFWVAAGLAFATGLVLHLAVPVREERGHRSPLPVWIKLPVIGCVVFGLIVVKQVLSGFMTLFPMVGVIAAYEARRSLWSVCRQIHALVLALVPMLAAIHLAQGSLGVGGALPAGWGVFLLVLVPLAWKMWFARPRAELTGEQLDDEPVPV